VRSTHSWSGSPSSDSLLMITFEVKPRRMLGLSCNHRMVVLLILRCPQCDVTVA
jgi:hypothetical protein